MLNKKYRFHSRGGVRYVYQKGKTARSPKINLVYTDNSRGFTRFAVVISKKVIKSAVGRNRVRRRVYEALRRNFEDIPLKKDYIFVVYHKSIRDIPFKELENILAELIVQSKI